MSPMERMDVDPATLALWAKHQYVISTPEFFVMAKPVHTDDDPNHIWHPANRTIESNCWLIHTFAGDPKAAWDHLPFALNYIMWYRVRTRKTYCLNSYRLWKRMIDNGISSKTS